MYRRLYRISRAGPSAVFIVLSVCISVLGLFVYTRQHDSRPAIGNYSDERAYWQKEIGTYGGAAAYEQMVQRYSTIPLAEAHDYAHAFGDSLYSVEGINGFDSCGLQYEWGCYHSFIQRAISSSGLSALDVIGKSCSSLPKEDIQECLHGLGHGILSSVGTEKLDGALELCESLTHPMYGCASGVFMELLNGNLHEGRPPLAYDIKKRYWPCTDVAAEFKDVCYRRLPSWWWNTLGLPTEEKLAAVGMNCSDIPDELFRTPCFFGIGYLFSSRTGYDASTTRADCNGLTGSTYRRACIYGAAFAAFQSTDYRERAKAICPPDESFEQCISAAERMMGANEGSLIYSP